MGGSEGAGDGLEGELESDAGSHSFGNKEGLAQGRVGGGMKRDKGQ